MKTYTEIEKLADEVYPTTDMGKLKSNMGFIQGYTQCQKDLNKDLYSEIENLIITWSNDGTKTAGTLTRQIMEKINNY
jgi:hypothetical protein